MLLRIFLFLFSIIVSSHAISQNQKECAFAEAYSSVRYFFPNSISESDWRMFNYSRAEQGISNDDNQVEVFSQLFNVISPLIQFSTDGRFESKLEPIENAVYWQHYGFGKKDGVYYKSCLVPIDRINYLYNGLQYFERVQGAFDSVDVQFIINQANSLNFTTNFLIYGWKTGKQIISKEMIHYDGDNRYHSRLRESFEDVYFRFFLEAEFGIDMKMESFTIVGYNAGNEQIIFSQDFRNPIQEQLDLGTHHSVQIQYEENRVLSFKSAEERTFYQIYQVDKTDTITWFSRKLSNGIYLHFPLVIDKSQLVDSIHYTPSLFSIEHFATLARSNLNDAYGHLMHFHPYFNTNTEDYLELYSKLYSSADTCSSLRSVRDLVELFLYPVKDAHMYVYNGLIPTPKKFMGLAVDFIGTRCFVKHSSISEIRPGDEILSFQGKKPWDLFQENAGKFLGSDHYVDYTSKKFLLIEDTTVLVQIEYKKHLKRKKYNGYASFYSDFTANQTKGIKLLKNDVYTVDLGTLEADTFINFIRQTKSIKGLILDGRNGINVESSILGMLTNDTLSYPKVLVPLHKIPFKTSLVYDTLNKTACILPQSELLCPVILMIGPKNFSHEETFIHLAAQIPHLRLAGTNSAGCNGMVTEYRGSGGFEIRFTGSIVEKIDESPLYNVGFKPQITVKKRRRDYILQNDPLVRKCLKVL